MNTDSKLSLPNEKAILPDSDDDQSGIKSKTEKPRMPEKIKTDIRKEKAKINSKNYRLR